MNRRQSDTEKHPNLCDPFLSQTLIVQKTFSFESTMFIGCGPLVLSSRATSRDVTTKPRWRRARFTALQCQRSRKRQIIRGFSETTSRIRVLVFGLISGCRDVSICFMRFALLNGKSCSRNMKIRSCK